MASNLVLFHYFSEKEVIETGITLQETVDLCTQSLSQHARKQIENPPKPGIHPLPDAFIHAMPAWLKESNTCGIKWVAGFPSNVPKKLPTIAGLIVLNDTVTGFPLAIMDGTYITGLRTAAVSGVSAKHLAKKDSEVLAVVGLGVQGKYNTLVLKHVLPSLKKVQVYDKWQPSLDHYVEDMKAFYGDKLEIVVKSNVEEAFTGADVIVTATGKLLETMYFEKWIKPGALVLPIHTGGFEKEIISKMDKVFVDDWPQFQSFAGPLYTQPASPDAELGEVVIGAKPGRDNDQQRIINFNVGLAIHDIIVARAVFEKALAKGLGTKLELMDVGHTIPLPPIV